MSVVEAGLRGSAVAILVLLAFFHLRDAGRSASARNRALFLLSAAAYTVCSAPNFPRLDLPFGLPLLLASLGAPALLWISAAAVFDHEFELSWKRGLAWAGLVALGLWSLLDSQALVSTGYYAASLLFIGLAAWHALGGWRAEFIEERRLGQAPIIVAATVHAATITIVDFGWPGSTLSAPFSLVNSIGLAILTFASAMMFLRIAGDSPSAVCAGSAGDHRSDMVTQPDAISLTFVRPDTALSKALRKLMDQQKLYREQGLSIGELGTRLGVPEYRLRRLINRELGHRNFSSFVNGYRLAEARKALADPTQAEVPILTIALDAGFQSLAPFNRAFKAATGTTPSDYRRRCLSRTNGEPQV
jgi:AraC-like DNA-binding protein